MESKKISENTKILFFWWYENISCKKRIGGLPRKSGEYVDSVKQKMPNYLGEPVGVDYNKPEVETLWVEVQGAINITNSVIKPFLELFGVE